MSCLEFTCKKTQKNPKTHQTKKVCEVVVKAVSLPKNTNLGNRKCIVGFTCLSSMMSLISKLRHVGFNVDAHTWMCTAI